MEGNKQITVYQTAKGKIRFTLKNDYMFKVVMESDEEFLKKLICALLHIREEDIKSIEVQNPILPGDTVTARGFILDILVLMNDDTIIDIEMQVRNLGNWPMRSTGYVVREYDNLSKGDDYMAVKTAVHIGFLDYTLFPEYPEFYATYKLMNVKNHNIYNDRLILGVVDMKRVDLATDEDKAYGIDQWVSLFNATTWEEMRALGAQNATFDKVGETLFRLSSDPVVIEQCRRIEENRLDYQRLVKDNANLKEDNANLKEDNANLKEDNANLKEDNVNLKEDNANLKDELKARDEQMKVKDEQIAKLIAKMHDLKLQSE